MELDINDKINRFLIKLRLCHICLLFAIIYLNPIVAQQNCGYKVFPDNCHPNIISLVTANWFFGKNAGLDFSTGSPQVIFQPGVNLLEGCAAISDTSGQFLFGVNFPFLTNNVSMNLVDEYLEELPGSGSMNGHYSASQNSLIVQQPGKEWIYYVFTVGVPLPAPYGHGLEYSVLDLSLEDSLLSKNNTLMFPIAEKITAVHHGNGRDVWIIVHEWDSDRFIAYLLTNQGLENPIASKAGIFHFQDDFNNNAIGCMKASPDGCHLAVAIYGQGIIELLEFDNTSGVVSNPVTSGADFQGVYGIEFSADSRMLYASTNDYSWNIDFPSKLYQFSLDDGGAIFDDPYEVASNSETDYLGLQLARDGKIYVARCKRELLPVEGYQYLGVIHNPNRRYFCNFNSVDHQSNEGLNLQEGQSRIGLPNFIQSYFDLPAFVFMSNCEGDLTRFWPVNTTNVDSVQWSFGDGTFSGELFPEHRFPGSGTYEVKFTDWFDGLGYPDSLLVQIYQNPAFEINNGPDTVILLPESFVSLDAGEGFLYYEWNTGETTRQIQASAEGNYWVTATNEHCCKSQDSIYVKLIRIVVPNAFIPGSSGADRYFRILDLENVIDDFSIFIYNRFGQLVFESDSKHFKWDGDGDGTGVFYYSMKATLIDGYEYIRNGNVTLIR